MNILKGSSRQRANDLTCLMSHAGRPAQVSY